MKPTPKINKPTKGKPVRETSTTTQLQRYVVPQKPRPTSRR